MAVYGYARVSTNDQDLTVQETALKAAGCDNIRSEKISGSSMDRPELKTLLEFMREGDTLVVTRIDRLARSLRDLQNMVHDLKERGINLKATEQSVDTSSAAGKAFFDMLGVFAEFETGIRKERQAEGIAKAQDAGKYKGRKPSIDKDKVRGLKDAGMSVSAIAKEMSISRMSVYRILDAV
jgi:DNA invertase Pin-like site-specific DNA recombinase